MPVREDKRQTRILGQVDYLKLRERLLEFLFVPCDDRHVGTSLREKNGQ